MPEMEVDWTWHPDGRRAHTTEPVDGFAVELRLEPDPDHSFPDEEAFGLVVEAQSEGITLAVDSVWGIVPDGDRAFIEERVHDHELVFIAVALAKSKLQKMVIRHREYLTA